MQKPWCWSDTEWQNMITIIVAIYGIVLNTLEWCPCNLPWDVLSALRQKHMHKSKQCDGQVSSIAQNFWFSWPSFSRKKNLIGISNISHPFAYISRKIGDFPSIEVTRWSRFTIPSHPIPTRQGPSYLLGESFYWDIVYMQALLVRPVLRLEFSALLAELWTSYNPVLWFS